MGTPQALSAQCAPALRFTSPQTLHIHSVCAKLTADEGVRVPGDAILWQKTNNAFLQCINM